MIKELFGWVSWVWRNWETWQKLWVVAMFFVGASVTASEQARPYLLAVPITIFFCCTFKWMVWDGFKSSWGKYKQHRNSMFETIKESDR